MERMYELISIITRELDKKLNENKDEPETHESYYQTPEHFEKIFHPSRRGDSGSEDTIRRQSNDDILTNSAEGKKE